MPDRPPHLGKHLTPGRAVLLALAALLLAFLLASHLTGARFAAEVEEIRRRGEPVRVSELVPKVPPGQPNAADRYARAFAVAPSSEDIHDAFDNLGQWSPQELAAAARLVATHPDYYELLDEASRVDVCAFPVNWDSGFLMEQYDLGRLADAGRALAVKAQVQPSHGDLDGAAATCSTHLRLAEHALQAPTMTGLVVSIAQRWVAGKGLARALALGDPSPELCRTLYAQLAKPDWQAAFTRALQAERADGLAALAQIEQGFLFHGFDRDDFRVDWATKALPYVARPSYNADKVGYLRTKARQIEASRRPR